MAKNQWVWNMKYPKFLRSKSQDACEVSMTDFEGVEKLCQGGFASISLATHNKSTKQCVLKILESPSPESLQRELWCLQNLQHRSIITSGALSLGLANGRSSFLSPSGSHVLCLEYANRGDLFDFIERSVLLEEEMARKLFLQLLDALAYLHDVGCCHLDVKTENVLLHQPLNGDLQVKLADFGLSHVAALGDNLGDLSQETGSDRSMAPEVHASEKFDGRCADMWSAGTVLFNMLTGYPPCKVAKLSDKSYAHIHRGNYDAFWRRFKSVANFSPQSQDLVNRLLRRNSMERLCAREAMKHAFVMVDPATTGAETKPFEEKTTGATPGKWDYRSVWSTTNEENEPGLCLGDEINLLWDAVSRPFADFDGDSVLTSDAVKVLTKIKKAPEKRPRGKSRKGKEVRKKSGILELSVAAPTKENSRQKFMVNLPVDCGFDIEDQVAMLMGYGRRV